MIMSSPLISLFHCQWHVCLCLWYKCQGHMSSRMISLSMAYMFSPMIWYPRSIEYVSSPTISKPMAYICLHLWYKCQWHNYMSSTMISVRSVACLKNAMRSVTCLNQITDTDGELRVFLLCRWDSVMPCLHLISIMSILCVFVQYQLS